MPKFLNLFLIAALLFIQCPSSWSQKENTTLKEIIAGITMKEGLYLDELCIFNITNEKDIIGENLTKKNFHEPLNELKKHVDYCHESKNLKENNCTFVGKVDHNDKEILHRNGNDIGLYEVDNIPKDAEVILKDESLVIEGANQMAYQLGDLALNGKSLHDVITGKENRDLFLNESGFVLSNIRYLRAFYCVQRVANEIVGRYKKMHNSKHALTQYTITGVWIGSEKILSAMKHVVEKKTEIENEIKNTSSTGLTQLRKELIKLIIKVAELEDAHDPDRSGNKGSSMALVGYFSLNKNTRNKDFSKCNKNRVNCLAFFHIMARTGASIESQEPTEDEDTEES